jgi:hypothetical protein
MTPHVKLRDIAGVGTGGDELAMRHVDHPHDAKGDGKSDRGEEVDRGQRQAVQRQIGGLDGAELGADGGKGLGGCGGHGGIGLDIDIMEGEGGLCFIIRGGLRHGACGLDRGIGAVAGALGVQTGRGYAAHHAVLQVGDRGARAGVPHAVFRL